MEEQNNNLTQSSEPSAISEPVEQTPKPEPQEPEIAIDENGELKFSDTFFDDMEARLQVPQEQEQEHELKSLEQQKYYTDDELNSTPFAQWDLAKLPPEIQKYASVVKQQLDQQAQKDLARQREQQQWQNYQQQIQAMQTPSMPAGLTEPKKLTPKELSEQAQKIARERLGIAADSELEFAYEPEHLAAFNQALNELSAQNKAEIDNFHHVVKDYQALQTFNREMSVRPDFMEFDRWFTGKLQERNLTPQIVEARLAEFARQGGGFSGVRDLIQSWYQEFRADKENAAQQMQAVKTTQAQAQSKPRTPKPPVLESSTGINNNAGKNFNLKNFGEMDLYQQGKILEEMGLV